jgi:phosphatidylglycerol:prolipoprotein diacylglycerol transferase
MHPVLFELPVPRLRLPLGLALGGVAVLALALALFGVRRRSLELLFLGGAGALGAGFGAFFYRGTLLALGPFPVPAFGALLSLSLGLGTLLTLRGAVGANLTRDRVLAACVAAGTAGVIGARVGYALLHPHEILELERLFAFRDGGLAVYGGLFFAVLAAFLVLDKNTEKLCSWLDAAAPGFGLGVLLTRIGCWLEGCDFGHALGPGAPAFVRTLGTFPSGSRAWVEQVLAQRITPAAPNALPVHPAELYEALGGVLLLGLAFGLRRQKHGPGRTALACLAAYALVRVAVDLFRDSSTDVWAARVLALPIALLSAAFWARLIPVSRPA